MFINVTEYHFYTESKVKALLKFTVQRFGWDYNHIVVQYKLYYCIVYYNNIVLTLIACLCCLRLWYKRASEYSEPGSWRVTNPSGENSAAVGHYEGHVGWFDISYKHQIKFICEEKVLTYFVHHWSIILYTRRCLFKDWYYPLLDSFFVLS